MIRTLSRYVAQEDGEKHLQFHWRSISYGCQPCRIGYQYIMDLETGRVSKFVLWLANDFRVLKKSLNQSKAGDDSTYVFNKLHFNTSLPSFHTTSKTKSSGPKNTMEEFYAEIPKALIKKIYAKCKGSTITCLFLNHIVRFILGSSRVKKALHRELVKP